MATQSQPSFEWSLSAYDGSNVLYSVDMDNEWKYLWGPGVSGRPEALVASKYSLATDWMLSDHQGTIRETVRFYNGAVTHIDYSPFGKVPSGTAPRFGYAGMDLAVAEATGLYYAGARFYDPSTGRFLSEDPAPASGQDKLNLYRYVGNDPLNQIDPTGTIAQGFLNRTATSAGGFNFGTPRSFDFRPDLSIGSTIATWNPSLPSYDFGSAISLSLGSSAPTPAAAIEAASPSPWKAPAAWAQPAGIGDVKVRMYGNQMEDGRIRLSYKWSQHVSGDQYNALNQYEMYLPAGTSQQTINRMRATATGMADDFGRLNGQQNLVKSLEQSRDILYQAGFTAATLGAGQVLSAARASQVAVVANTARVGQAGMGAYFAYQGGKGVVRGAQQLHEGEYLAGSANIALGGIGAWGGYKMVGSAIPRLDLGNYQFAMAGESGYLGANRILKYSPPQGAGEYASVGGHHVHAKRAFEGHTGYDAKQAFAVGEQTLRQYGVRHADITGSQQRLFREFATSGQPNTLTHHSRIAYQSMVEAGMAPNVAKSLVIQSQSRLIRSGIVEPTSIPWGGR